MLCNLHTIALPNNVVLVGIFQITSGNIERINPIVVNVKFKMKLIFIVGKHAACIFQV